MTTLLMQKRFGSLRPVDHQSAEALTKLSVDQTYRVEAKRLRKPHQHRLYFALVEIVWEHQTRYATREQLHNALKVAVGYYDEITTKSGQRIAVPHSIAFGNMGQDAFEEFFNAVVRLVCTQILPGTEDGALRRELEEMVGVRSEGS